MKPVVDLPFLRLAMLVLAGHRFWVLPLLPLAWPLFQAGVRFFINGDAGAVSPGDVQGMIAVPLTALGVFLGMRIIAGEIDDRSLEIAYTVPGGVERLWWIKLAASLLTLIAAECLLALCVWALFTPFPPGMLYGSLQAACFYMIIAMAMGALFKSEASAVITTLVVLAANGILMGFGDNQLRFTPFFNPYTLAEGSQQFTSDEELLAWTVQNRIAMALVMAAILGLAFVRGNRREELLP